MLVAMLEDVRALDELDSILAVEGLDAVLLGPYDLSASLHQTAKFNHPNYLRTLKTILRKAQTFGIPLGIHVVEPSTNELKKRIRQGFRFIPFSMDSVLLRKGLEKKI
jgi:2-dehydro-3-deoxyglucarate aldolase